MFRLAGTVTRMSAAPVATAVPAAAAVSVAAAATNVARGYASMETALHRPIPANNEDTAFDFSEENYKEVERILSKVWWLGVHLIPIQVEGCCGILCRRP